MAWFSDMMDKWVLKKAYKWGRGRAKIKLFAFCTLRDAHPEIPIEDLYYLTVLTSHGFNEYITRRIIIDAKEEAGGYVSIAGMKFPAIFPEPFSLRSVVKKMLSYEESTLFRGKGFPCSDCIFEAWKAVDDIIPADL